MLWATNSWTGLPVPPRTFSTFRYCQSVPNVQICWPKGDGLSSFTNLLGMDIHRVCIWAIAVVTLGGNMFVLLCRLILREEKSIHSLFIRNMCGVYSCW